MAGLNARTSTNAESLHSSLKYGLYYVTAGMSTTTSCNRQASKAEMRAKDMSKEIAQKVYKNVVQENSRTRAMLTPWAEKKLKGQRKQMDNYWIVQVSKTKFLMMKNRCEEADKDLKDCEKGDLY